MKSLDNACIRCKLFEPDFACKENCCASNHKAMMPDECIDCKYYKPGFTCREECAFFHYPEYAYVPYCDVNFHCPEDEGGIPLYWDCDDCPHWR